MTVYDWPRDSEWRPISGKFRLANISQVSLSPYTGSQKVLALQQVWHADLDFNNHLRDDGIDMQGFIDGLEGGANSVRLFDPWRIRPRLLSLAQSGFSDGTFFDDGTGFLDGYSLTVLNAAAKGATAVALTGFPASQIVMKRGDLLSINGFLYQTRYDVSSNAAGQALVTIQPGLRAGVAAGDAVPTDFASVSMTLLNAGDAVVPRIENYTGPFTLSFVEVIP